MLLLQDIYLTTFHVKKGYTGHFGHYKFCVLISLLFFVHYPFPQFLRVIKYPQQIF